MRKKRTLKLGRFLLALLVLVSMLIVTAYASGEAASNAKMVDCPDCGAVGVVLLLCALAFSVWVYLRAEVRI